MAATSKRVGENVKKIDQAQSYTPDGAIRLLKELRPAKFDESVDVSVNLGVDGRKGDQIVRGAMTLPHQLGRTVSVAVFADGDQMKQAADAGADAVGMEDLIETAGQGDFPYDVVIATPAAMPKVASLGPILGPRGLMPNPKMGTVSDDVATAVRNAKQGQARYRADKSGIVHCSIGRISIQTQHLVENFEAFINELKRVKPASVKGLYIKKVTVSSTMSPGIKVDVAG